MITLTWPSFSTQLVVRSPPAIVALFEPRMVLKAMIRHRLTLIPEPHLLKPAIDVAVLCEH